MEAPRSWRRRVADWYSAGTPRQRGFVPCTNGWKVHDPLQPPRRADTRHLRCHEGEAIQFLIETISSGSSAEGRAVLSWRQHVNPLVPLGLRAFFPWFSEVGDLSQAVSEVRAAALRGVYPYCAPTFTAGRCCQSPKKKRACSAHPLSGFREAFQAGTHSYSCIAACTFSSASMRDLKRARLSNSLRTDLLRSAVTALGRAPCARRAFKHGGERLSLTT
jgi:hypothetical protein